MSVPARRNFLTGQSLKISKMGKQTLALRQLLECLACPVAVGGKNRIVVCLRWLRCCRRLHQTMLAGNSERTQTIYCSAASSEQEAGFDRTTTRVICIRFLPRFEKNIMQQVFGIAAVLKCDKLLPESVRHTGRTVRPRPHGLPVGQWLTGFCRYQHPASQFSTVGGCLRLTVYRNSLAEYKGAAEKL